jgi:hypothetical protein
MRLAGWEPASVATQQGGAPIHNSMRTGASEIDLPSRLMHKMCQPRDMTVVRPASAQGPSLRLENPAAFTRRRQNWDFTGFHMPSGVLAVWIGTR